MEPALPGGVQLKDKRQWESTKSQEILVKHEKNCPYHEGGQTMAQVALRACGFSVLGVSQNSTGCGPK